MKWNPAILGLVVTALLFSTSCTREYVCQCEIVYSGKPGLPDPRVNEYDIRDTRENAQRICEQNSYVNEVEGIKTEETCLLY